MTATLYTRPVGNDGPWQEVGNVDTGPTFVPDDTVKLGPLLSGGSVTVTFQMDRESTALLRRWWREERRRWIGQRRVRQQMRHVRQRAARRARRSLS